MLYAMCGVLLATAAAATAAGAGWVCCPRCLLTTLLPPDPPAHAPLPLPLPRWERLGKKVALDVALGLNYLHSQRPPMMHRDLKSPNVLLSEEGVAKIADVGMVRTQVKDLVTAQPVMTPLWAAPEVGGAAWRYCCCTAAVVSAGLGAMLCFESTGCACVYALVCASTPLVLGMCKLWAAPR
jgi:serine/threonine protein kinase